MEIPTEKLERLGLDGAVKQVPLAPARRPLADTVYVEVRTKILRGEHRPNERLTEQDLAAALSVSRTPVRSALFRLVEDGLVVLTRHGWTVKEHTADDIREIYELRIGLEGLAARLATERVTEEELEVISELYPADLTPLIAGPREHLVDRNTAFHTAIAAATRNERLLRTWQRSRQFNLNLRLASSYADDEMHAALSGHRAIIEAFAAGDADAAEEAARDHVRLALDTALKKLT